MENGKSHISRVSLKVDIRVEGGNVTFWLRVKPRSSRERLSVDSRGELRVELHAVPTDGQANVACIDFLARLLSVPRSNIGIVMGYKSRRKLIRILGGVEIAQRLKSEVADLSAFCIK